MDSEPTPLVRYNLTNRFARHDNVQQELQALADIVDEAPYVCDKDVYGAGSMLNKFEDTIAKTLGKEAGMFCVSGVMAQQIALKLHSEALGSCKRFAIHPTSHLELHEHQVRKLAKLCCSILT